MIGCLRGKLLLKKPPHLMVDVNGVGYEAEAPMSTFYNLPDLNSEVTLFTHLVVRDDAHILFAFGSEAEKRFFRSLIRINGVGPKLALTILSGISPDSFVRSVHENDIATLTRLPGIGKKTAERMVIEIRDRLDEIETTVSTGSINPRDEALGALIALGYKPPEAAQMLRGIKQDGLSSEELIRRALQGALRNG
jgi:holliday junction DNA helicase RuvA